ncbi:MAG: TonB family protein [Deltaproteobacteria bacterium]|jgi:colicin import membrane protein|nr:TonB family protein [Deltaproteobacteria bacterium]
MSSKNQIIQGQKKSFLNPVDQSRKIGTLFFIISILVHGLFFFGLIFLQEFKLSKPLPPVIQIDLVSFAPEPLIEESPETEAKLQKDEISTKKPDIKKPAIKKKSRKIPTIKPDISLKTKPKNLKELIALQKKKPEKKKEKKPVEKIKPKKKVDPDKVLKEAREQLEEQIEEQNQDRLAQALSRLKKKIKDQGPKQSPITGYGKKGTPKDTYNQIIQFAFQQNWVFNDTLARMDQKFEVKILLKILKSGEIRDIIYETRSGNHYLDESAKKAIKKANPLPPLPAGMHSYDLLIGFTPKGLK